MDWSLPGSSIHGVFQAGVLEWGAIAFSEKDDMEMINLHKVSVARSLTPSSMINWDEFHFSL